MKLKICIFVDLHSNKRSLAIRIIMSKYHTTCKKHTAILLNKTSRKRFIIELNIFMTILTVQYNMPINVRFLNKITIFTRLFFNKLKNTQTFSTNIYITSS